MYNGQPFQLSRTNRSRPSSSSTHHVSFSRRVVSSPAKAQLSALVAKGAVVPPVPFPNTVVKHGSTNNTAPSTGVGRSAAASAVSFFLFELQGDGFMLICRLFRFRIQELAGPVSLSAGRSSLFPRSFLPSHRTGSKYSSATRSLRGMMELSVM